MANATETVVERELVIAAAPETVWELLVDPEQVHGRAGDRGKRLVDLEEVDVVDATPQLLQRRLDR